MTWVSKQSGFGIWAGHREGILERYSALMMYAVRILLITAVAPRPGAVNTTAGRILESPVRPYLDPSGSVRCDTT